MDDEASSRDRAEHAGALRRYRRRRRAVAAEQAAEVAQARRLAERYRLPFLDLAHFNIDHDLFRTIPAELMLRYGFVPYRPRGERAGRSSSATRPTCR